MDELREKLIKEMNEANLPPEAIFYVIKDVYRDVVESYEAYKKEVSRAETEEQ